MSLNTFEGFLNTISKPSGYPHSETEGLKAFLSNGIKNIIIIKETPIPSYWRKSLQSLQAYRKSLHFSKKKPSEPSGIVIFSYKAEKAFKHVDFISKIVMYKRGALL